MDSLAVRMQEMIQENNRQLAQLFGIQSQQGNSSPTFNKVLALFTVLMGVLMVKWAKVFLAVIMVQLMVEWIKALWEVGWAKILILELILFMKGLLPVMAFTQVL
jgi:hypothetical protein